MMISTVGIVMSSRRMMKRSILVGLSSLLGVIRLRPFPLGLIVLNINELPWVKSQRIAVHSLHIGLLHPVNRRRIERNHWLLFEHVGFGLRKQLEAFLRIALAVRSIEHR